MKSPRIVAALILMLAVSAGYALAQAGAKETKELRAQLKKVAEERRLIAYASEFAEERKALAAYMVMQHADTAWHIHPKLEARLLSDDDEVFNEAFEEAEILAEVVGKRKEFVNFGQWRVIANDLDCTSFTVYAELITHSHKDHLSPHHEVRKYSVFLNVPDDGKRWWVDSKKHWEVFQDNLLVTNYDKVVYSKVYKYFQDRNDSKKKE